MNGIKQLLAELQKSLQDKFSSQTKQPVETEPQQSTWQGFDAQYRPQLETLKQNLLDQTPYTPQAENEIKNNMNFYPIVGETNAGGMASLNDIMLNPNFTEIPEYQMEVGRHEALHNLDDSMWDSSDVNSFGDSTGFAKEIKQNMPGVHSDIKNRMDNSGLYDPKNIQSLNMENFAFAGSDPNIMLSPLANRYKNIYQPMSKEINYSPVYPSQEFQKGSKFF